MISKEELKELGKRKNYHLGQAEKDYLQDLILFSLYQEFGPELVFKGGTALAKCYGLDRFSQDLDFTASTQKDPTDLVSAGLRRFLFSHETIQKSHPHGVKTIFQIRGPLFNGSRLSLCRIEVDISRREPVLLKPENRNIGRFLPETPRFTVVAMSPREILAEKVRAILTRNLARDLYDLHFLVSQDIPFDRPLIEKKLSYYNMDFHPVDVTSAIDRKEDLWEKELKPLLRTVPAFDTIRKDVYKHVIADLDDG